MGASIRMGFRAPYNYNIEEDPRDYQQLLGLTVYGFRVSGTNLVRFMCLGCVLRCYVIFLGFYSCLSLPFVRRTDNRCSSLLLSTTIDYDPLQSRAGEGVHLDNRMNLDANLACFASSALYTYMSKIRATDPSITCRANYAGLLIQCTTCP